MTDKKKEYVAYTSLGQYEPGDVVDPSSWTVEEWRYMVEHEVVVPKNSPNDPSVLAQASQGAGHDEALTNPDAPASPAVQEALDAHAEASKGKDVKDEDPKDTDKTEPKDADKTEDKAPVKPATPTSPPASVKPVAKPLPKP